MSEEYVPSPCVGVCRIDTVSKLCEGCARTIEEIIDWPIMTAAEKHAVLERIEIRCAQDSGNHRKIN